MFKFFRKVRQKLISRGKTWDYLKYAIGEIVLVVIGILIALQINNWNEAQKNDRMEAAYYCRLLEDIDQDVAQINQLIQSAQDRLKASNQAVRLLLTENPTRMEVGKQIWLANKAIYIDFRPNNSTFQDLKSGARLNIIDDKEVVKALNTYYNNLESLKSIIMVNGANALDRYNGHADNFANGDNQASMKYGRFKDGMEPDVYQAIGSDSVSTISDDMQQRLYNEALVYISANTRQLELYGTIGQFSEQMRRLLSSRCTGGE
jgi:hypothetical protein